MRKTLWLGLVACLCLACDRATTRRAAQYTMSDAGMFRSGVFGFQVYVPAARLVDTIARNRFADAPPGTRTYSWQFLGPMDPKHWSADRLPERVLITALDDVRFNEQDLNQWADRTINDALGRAPGGEVVERTVRWRTDTAEFQTAVHDFKRDEYVTWHCLTSHVGRPIGGAVCVQTGGHTRESLADVRRSLRLIPQERAPVVAQAGHVDSVRTHAPAHDVMGAGIGGEAGFTTPSFGPGFGPDWQLQPTFDSVARASNDKILDFQFVHENPRQTIFIEVLRDPKVATDEAEFRAYVGKLHAGFRPPAIAAIREDTVIWTAGRREHRFDAAKFGPLGQRPVIYKTRCVASGPGVPSPYVVCISTTATDPRALDGVREGLALTQPSSNK